MNIEQDIHSLKWTVYKADKEFLTFQGVFQRKASPMSWSNMNKKKQSKPEARCRKLGSGCVGIEKNKNGSQIIFLEYLDLDTFKSSEDEITLVKAADADEELKIVAKGSKGFSGINVCCPLNQPLDFESVKGDIHDTLPRISCQMPKEEFLNKFIKTQQPAILLNCSSEWPAQRYWTSETLFSHGDGETTWSSQYVINYEPLQATTLRKENSGKMLQSVINRNGTVHVFAEISLRNDWQRRRRGDTTENEKMKLLDEFSTPEAVPMDMYAAAGIPTNYHWVIINQADTGTELHMDPPYTMAWNTVLRGRKWWVLLPPELPHEQVVCNRLCSKTKLGDFSTMSWFTHILPQLRGRKWYGNTVKEFILREGETLYLPPNTGHTIMNLEDSIAVTENFFTIDSLEDYIHGVMAGKSIVQYNHDSEELTDFFWKPLYNKLLGNKERAVARAIMEQVEQEIQKDPEICKTESLNFEINKYGL
eukprot:TRINITY_DN5196_c0_g1_i2.p1 TRINITY_DN5196_c0_g1~~TRINITY_DN5196_c0_g1_i2.p1  ORF type:complete len:477 (+),score=100.44 TRINITY_DN5196_c0_g1_i2:326-1756(+)